MPLHNCQNRRGKDKGKCMSKNIAIEIKAGKPRKQAIAIGLSTGKKKGK